MPMTLALWELKEDLLEMTCGVLGMDLETLNHCFMELKIKLHVMSVMSFLNNEIARWFSKKQD